MTTPEHRVIKRYSNRKMYDTLRSSYITLEEISVLIKEGCEVQVVDNKSGEDLTSVTLAQIIFEEEKRNKGRMPLRMLKNMLAQQGEVWSDFYRDRVEIVQEKAQLARQRATEVGRELREGWGARIDKMRQRDDPHKDSPAENVTSPQGEQSLDEVMSETQSTWDDIHSWLDVVIGETIRPMEYYKGLSEDFAALETRIEQIEQRLDALIESNSKGRKRKSSQR